MKVRRMVMMICSLLPAAMLLGACGSSSKSSSSTPAASSPATNTTPAMNASPVMITAKHDKLGTVLAAGPKQLTVYLFEADRGPSSHCAGACAAAWPPVTGKPDASGAAHQPDLGTIIRPGGATQVTYKGHPLYYFVKDKDDGDTYGEGVKAFGAAWYALRPSGAKVDNS